MLKSRRSEGQEYWMAAWTVSKPQRFNWQALGWEEFPESELWAVPFQERTRSHDADGCSRNLCGVPP